MTEELQPAASEDESLADAAAPAPEETLPPDAPAVEGQPPAEETPRRRGAGRV